MEAIKTQIQDLYCKADEEGRRQLQDAIRDLQNSFDTEWDMVVRVAASSVQMTVVKIFVDLNIFPKLASSSEPLSLAQLAEETGAAPSLLGHFLRAAAAFGLIKETSQDMFTSNRLTRALADVNVSGAIPHIFDVHMPVAQATPAFFKENNYQPITSDKNLPFHKAMQTDLAPFEWMKQRPEQMKALGHGMAIQRPGNWTSTYPITTILSPSTPSPTSALLVDIGGGFGHQALAFHTAFPSLPGRIIVQDIPSTLSSAKPIPDIEFMQQDFFEPQQIKDANIYYLRHILHDWTKGQCVEILKNVVGAMGTESRVVVDEVVLPSEKVLWQAAYMDLTMMTSLGGVERTRAEFEEVMDEAGLKVVDVHKYDEKMQSVIVAVKK